MPKLKDPANLSPKKLFLKKYFEEDNDQIKRLLRKLSTISSVRISEQVSKSNLIKKLEWKQEKAKEFVKMNKFAMFVSFNIKS